MKKGMSEIDKKKNILMISITDIGSNESLGVSKKILGQYKAFQNIGYNVYNLCLYQGQVVIIHDDNCTMLSSKKAMDYYAYIKLFGSANKIVLEKQIDICYIRYPLADWVFMKTIKELKGLCENIIEMPTFPYDYDMSRETNIIANIDYWQDRRNRERIKKYIDMFVNYHGYEEIYGVRALPIDNGIDCDTVKYVGDLVQYKSDINLIGVALIINIHGYDRLIKGIKAYYSQSNNKRKIMFYIVGDGPEVPHLINMVNEYGLNDYVVFTGVKAGEELDKLFADSNIAVASLAAHRRGGKVTSELKVKEYCARGIPYIATSKDNAIPDNLCFNKLFPANDNPIDIEQVIEFYEYIKAHPEIHRQMRTYAEENLTWEKQLKKVMEAIEQ